MSATEENVGIAQTTSGESRPTVGLTGVRKPKMRVRKPRPCHCSMCDAPNALLVTHQHELPGYEHIQIKLAVCLRHAEQLASLLLHHVRAATRMRRARP